MGLFWRSRKRVGRGTYLNLSKSGASVSKQVGRLRVSSRGRVSFRLGRGITWRGKL